MSKNEINISKPTKNKKNIFKSKRKEIKKRLKKPSMKKIFKSKMEVIKEILHDPIKKKKIIISQNELAMLLVVTTLSIKVMEIKIKHYHPKIVLMKLSHI